MKASAYAGSSNWLKASDIGDDAAEQRILTIKSVEEGMQKDKDGFEKPQLVLHFKEVEKQFGLNVTNTKAVIAALGDETDDWVGGKITLFTTYVNDPGGNSVLSIRIKQKAAGARSKQAEEPLTDDSVPF